MNRIVHVMVGILRDRDGRILINQRPPGKVQAGRWEFPGGKLEPGESPEAGLRRELHEELGIIAGTFQPLIEIRHDYPEFSVRLDVREARTFNGEPHARENQPLAWALPEELPAFDILEADRPITRALRLPDTLLVTPDPAASSRRKFLDSLESALVNGAGMVLFRAGSLSDENYVSLARDVLARCRAHERNLLLNRSIEILKVVGADGLHLDSRRLRQSRSRSLDDAAWLSASCHNASELAHAERIGVDFALLGPVLPTLSHPGAPVLGWAGFRTLVSRSVLPVFALGGMSAEHVANARANGGRGIAAIRGLWPNQV